MPDRTAGRARPSQRLDRGLHALVRHELEARAGDVLEVDRVDVGAAGRPDIADADLAGIGLHPGDQLLQVRGREILARGDHQRVARQQRDRLEIAAQIIGQRIDRAVDDVRAVVAVAQRIAVGRRLHRAFDAGHARLAGDILDHDRLAERLAHALGERAREAVRRTAGEIGHDHRDRPRRIGLRTGDIRQRRKRGGACRQAEKCSARKCHDVTPL